MSNLVPILILLLTVPVGIITSTLLGDAFPTVGTWLLPLVFSAYAAAMAVFTQLDHIARDRDDRRYALVPTGLLGIAVMIAVFVAPAGMERQFVLLTAGIGIEALVIGTLIALINLSTIRAQVDAHRAY